MTKVASIHWGKLTASRSLYGGLYVLEAVPLGGEPRVLAIEDKIQSWQGPYILSPDRRRRPIQSAVIRSFDIARDIVNEWTATGVGMTHDCHPGVWLGRERLPVLNADGSAVMDAEGKAVWRGVSDEERNALWAEDEAHNRRADRQYAEMLIRKADMLAEDPRRIQFISQRTKDAARHYGIEREWLSEMIDAGVRPCIYCTKVIPSAAIVCPHCQQVVDMERYARLEARKTAALLAAGASEDRSEVVSGS